MNERRQKSAENGTDNDHHQVHAFHRRRLNRKTDNVHHRTRSNGNIPGIIHGKAGNSIGDQNDQCKHDDISNHLSVRKQFIKNVLVARHNPLYIRSRISKAGRFLQISDDLHQNDAESYRNSCKRIKGHGSDQRNHIMQIKLSQYRIENDQYPLIRSKFQIDKVKQ